MRFHRNLKTAEELFSDVSLFWYLDDVMDSILLPDVPEAAVLPGKMQREQAPVSHNRGGIQT
jgi:hypothetical protein